VIKFLSVNVAEFASLGRRLRRSAAGVQQPFETSERRHHISAIISCGAVEKEFYNSFRLLT